MINRCGAWQRLAVCCLMSLTSGVWAGDDAERPDGDGFERLKTYLGQMQHLRAEFSQQVLGADEEIVEQASGSVVLSKPGRFRWDYRVPYTRTIVADGERVWFYDADLEQVTIRRMAAGIGDTPAALLTGDVAALDQFELLGTWTDGRLDWLQLAPRSAEADFSTVDIGFAGGDIEQMEFLDRLGQRTRIVLSGIVRSPPPTEAEFRFEIPAGVDVIGADDI